MSRVLRIRAAGPVMVLLATCLVVAGCGSTTATDDLTPVQSEREHEDAGERHALLWPVVELEAMDGFQGGGFESLDSDVVVVYWHGDLPAAAQQVVDKAGEQGVEVSVVHVTHSEDDLVAVASRVWDALTAIGIEPNGLSVIGPHQAVRDDRAGVGVEIFVDKDISAESLSAARDAVDAMGLDVVVTITERDEPCSVNYATIEADSVPPCLEGFGD